jgi:acyl carrier protein
MKTNAEILIHITSVLVELFELDASDITPEAHLYDDLDIDSIDAVDLVVELKKWSGKKIQPDDFKTVRTVQDVVDAVAALIND